MAALEVCLPGAGAGHAAASPTRCGASGAAAPAMPHSPFAAAACQAFPPTADAWGGPSLAPPDVPRQGPGAAKTGSPSAASPGRRALREVNGSAAAAADPPAARTAPRGAARVLRMRPAGLQKLAAAAAPGPVARQPAGAQAGAARAPPDVGRGAGPEGAPEPERAAPGRAAGARGSTSRYVGVSWNSNSAKWRAQMWLGRELHHLGYFEVRAACMPPLPPLPGQHACLQPGACHALACSQYVHTA